MYESQSNLEEEFFRRSVEQTYKNVRKGTDSWKEWCYRLGSSFKVYLEDEYLDDIIYDPQLLICWQFPEILDPLDFPGKIEDHMIICHNKEGQIITTNHYDPATKKNGQLYINSKFSDEDLTHIRIIPLLSGSLTTNEIRPIASKYARNKLMDSAEIISYARYYFHMIYSLKNKPEVNK